MHCIQMAEDIVKLLSRPGTPTILVFWPERWYSIPRGPLQRGAKYTTGGTILRFSTEIADYLVNRRRINMCRFLE